MQPDYYLLCLDKLRQSVIIMNGIFMRSERGRPAEKDGKETAFGQWLKAKREALGWSSEQAAERFGLSQSMVSLYERGVRSPKRETALRIGEALGDIEGSLKAAGYAPPTPNPEESEFVRAMLSASPEQKALIRGMLRSWGLGFDIDELGDTESP